MPQPARVGAFARPHPTMTMMTDDLTMMTMMMTTMTELTTTCLTTPD
jgi:hypothetical protein